MGQFEDFDENAPPPKSKKPIFIGLAAVSVLLVGYLIVSSMGPSLSTEETAVFWEAQALMRKDDYSGYPEAEKKLLLILDKKPEFVPAVTWLTQLYCAWGEQLGHEGETFQRAAQGKAAELKDLNKILETSKSKSAKKAAAAKMETGKTELQDLNKAMKLKGEESVKRLASAKQWGKLGANLDYDDAQLQRAMADYARITEKWPDVQTRLAYVKKNKPDSAGLRFISGAVLMEKDKDFAGAIALYDDALTVDPAFTKAQYYKALALDRKGDKEAAVTAMKRTLEMSPQHPGARSYLGRGRARTARERLDTGTAMPVPQRREPPSAWPTTWSRSATRAHHTPQPRRVPACASPPQPGRPRPAPQVTHVGAARLARRQINYG